MDPLATYTVQQWSVRILGLYDKYEDTKGVIRTR